MSLLVVEKSATPCVCVEGGLCYRENIHNNIDRLFYIWLKSVQHLDLPFEDLFIFFLVNSWGDSVVDRFGGGKNVPFWVHHRYWQRILIFIPLKLANSNFYTAKFSASVWQEHRYLRPAKWRYSKSSISVCFTIELLAAWTVMSKLWLIQFVWKKSCRF